MPRHKFPSLFALMIVAAVSTFAPRATHSQSKTDCGALQRKEFALTALDKNGDVIDGLRAENLSLKVGDSRATISDLVFQTNNQPFDLVILIDASVSQEKVLPFAKAGARSFIASLATAGRDRIAVVSFSDKPTGDPVLTSDFGAVMAAIDRIHFEAPPGYVGGGMVISTSPPKKPLAGSTSLWDAVRTTTQALFGANAEKRRRVMLLFSDGNDTSSSGTLTRAIEDAIKYDMAVFSIGLADPIFSVSEGPLKKLSEQTGGVAGFPDKKRPLDVALNDILKRLRANYVVGYCRELNNQGKLQVEVVDPEIRKVKPVLAYKRTED